MNRKECYIFNFIPIIIATCCVLFADGLLSKKIISILLLMVIFAANCFLNQYVFEKIDTKLIQEILIISFIAFTFFWAAALSPYSIKVKIFTIILIVTAVSCLFGNILVIYLKKIKLFCKLKTRLTKKLVGNRLFIIILALICIFRLVQMGVVPRWDSEWYFYEIVNACQKFDFNFSTFLETFRLAGHPSIGYAIFLTIGGFLTPGSIVGVQIINMILYLGAICFTYNMLTRIFPNKSRDSLAFSTFAISMAPMACGGFLNINLDFGVLVFFVYLLYMHMTKRYILFVFFGIVLSQTKETGILVVGCYIIGYLIAKIVLAKSKIRYTIIETVKNPMFIIGCILLIFYILYHIIIYAMGFSQVWGTSGNTEGSALAVTTKKTTDLLNCFSFFNITYIVLKLKTIFALNFMWIPSFIIMVGVIIGLWEKRRRKLKIFEKIPVEFAGLAGAFIGLTFFALVYITHNNPRYNMLQEYVILLVAIIVLNYMLTSKKAYLLIFSCLTLLLGIESYTVIDPVSLYLFPSYPTSENASTRMVLPAWNNNPYLADTLVCNNQFSYMDKAYDRILKKNNYSGESLIFGNNDWGVYFTGRRFEYSWNTKENKREIFENENTISINVVEDLDEALKEETMTDEIILIITPQYQVNVEKILKKLSAKYDMGEKNKEVIWGQGEIIYYIGSKK